MKHTSFPKVKTEKRPKTYTTAPPMSGEQKTANECPVLKEYWCFDKACGIDHKKQCMMINPKDKIYVDGSKVGDYIQQNIAFRREMEKNYAKTLDENAALKESLAELIPFAEREQRRSTRANIIKAAIERAKKLIAENREQSQQLPPQEQES